MIAPAIALDYLGVGFFALTGAMAAAERRQDIVTFIFFGAVTGVGGGTLRDLLIGAPVVWVHDPVYLIVCTVTALAVWILRGRGLHPTALLWMDALGLSAYAVVGAAKASAAGLGAPVCVAMGVLTACFGGILRDVLAEQPSVLLRREIYVTAAIAAAGVWAIAHALGLPATAAMAIGAVSGFAVRGAALMFGLSLPQYRPHQA